MSQSLDPPNQKLLDPPLLTRYVCIHVEVIPSEGKKKKSGETTYNGHATEKVQQRILCRVKLVVVFICLPFIFSVPPLDTS